VVVELDFGNCCLKDETMPADLTEELRDTINSAATKLTGARRREFQAEMTLKYCNGSPRTAERVFGWGRDAVRTGLNEVRTGIRCVENFSARGRHKTEVEDPAIAAQIHVIVEPETQADPKFQTPLAFTRLTAKAVHQQLVADYGANHVPTERTIHNILNRLGYRLRRVRKAMPKKKYPRPTRSSLTCNKFTPKPSTTPKYCAFHSTQRRK